jgi:hypothetical protein
VTNEAERTYVGQVARASAFHYRDNVISVPETSALANAFEPPVLQLPEARGSATSFQLVVRGKSICPAGGTDSFIALQGHVAEEARIGAKTPLLDAKVGAEGLPAFGNFKLAPTAEIPTIRTFGKVGVSPCLAALQGSLVCLLPLLQVLFPLDGAGRLVCKVVEDCRDSGYIP